MSVTYLNKNFRFVFTPKLNIYNGKTRFLIGAGSLGLYLGDTNANNVEKSALKSKTDKVTLKFRKVGKLEIYVK